jgi:hypothetical protein
VKKISVVEDEAIVALEIKDRLRTLGLAVLGGAAVIIAYYLPLAVRGMRPGGSLRKTRGEGGRG